MRELVNPNWHVILIHYPLAFLGVGILIELFSFLWRRSGFRAAGRWMILLGALLSIPTAFSGIYAFRDVVIDQQSLTWEEAKAESQLNQTQWDMIERHLWLNSAATVVFVFVVVLWLGCSDKWRSRLHIPLMILLLAGMGLTSMGAWVGGEMVYVHRVGVEPDPPVVGEHPAEQVASPPTLRKRIERVVPPLQAHATGAGLMVAIAMAALGLSIRAMTTGEPSPEWDEFNVGEKKEPVANELPIITEFHRAFVGDVPRESQTVEVRRVPSTRFWLLSALIGLLVAGGGLWVANIESWEEVLEMLRDSERDRAHAVLGISIVTLTLVLAACTRWAPRSKMLLAIFSLLLVTAVAAQVWMGILLMYDTREGSITKFNPAPAPTTQPAEIRLAG
jgi:uncharacterized membrane protein